MEWQTNMRFQRLASEVFRGSFRPETSCCWAAIKYAALNEITVIKGFSKKGFDSFRKDWSLPNSRLRARHRGERCRHIAALQLRFCAIKRPNAVLTFRNYRCGSCAAAMSGESFCPMSTKNTMNGTEFHWKVSWSDLAIFMEICLPDFRFQIFGGKHFAR